MCEERGYCAPAMAHVRGQLVGLDSLLSFLIEPGLWIPGIKPGQRLESKCIYPVSHLTSHLSDVVKTGSHVAQGGQGSP